MTEEPATAIGVLLMASRLARLGAWRFDMVSRRLILSSGSASIFNAGKQESTTVDFILQQCAPDCRDTVTRLFNEGLQQGTSFDEVISILAAGGERLWARMTGEAEFNRAGEIVALQGAVQEITGQMQAEENIRVSEERFRLLAQFTSGAVWDWDAVTGHVWRSNGFSTEFGYEPSMADPTLDWWFDHIHPEDRDRVATKFKSFMASDAIVWQDEHRFLHRDGKYRDVLDRGCIIRDKAGRALRTIGSRADVTSKRRIDELLQQAQKLEAIGHLTGGVAHDFNNLLTVILANAEVLTQELSNQGRLQRMAEMTMKAALRGADLTQRLLAFARRQPLNPKRVDLNSLVAGIDGMLRRTLSAAIDIEFVRAGGLWPVELDPGQVESALLNLAVNARDAMPKGGSLTIETANAWLDDDYAALYDEVTAGQYVMLSVSDTGTGMPPEVVAKAFDPFFTTKEVGKGTGLGLSMVYGFVKQSGGHIKIYSELGEGTVVKMYFPRAQSAAAAFDDAETVSRVSGRGELILVVEDDDLVRVNCVSQLESLGYRVISAQAGDEALRLLEATPDVDLLFTDIIMPGTMNGRELADAARRLYPSLKVLFTSGYTENAIVHQGRLDSGVILLNKPYRRNVLASKIREALQNTVHHKK